MKDDILKFAYRAGLHDATAQQAYPAKKAKKEGLSPLAYDYRHFE